MPPVVGYAQLSEAVADAALRVLEVAASHVDGAAELEKVPSVSTASQNRQLLTAGLSYGWNAGGTLGYATAAEAGCLLLSVLLALAPQADAALPHCLVDLLGGLGESDQLEEGAALVLNDWQSGTSLWYTL